MSETDIEEEEGGGKGGILKIVLIVVGALLAALDKLVREALREHLMAHANLDRRFYRAKQLPEGPVT